MSLIYNLGKRLRMLSEWFPQTLSLSIIVLKDLVIVLCNYMHVSSLSSGSGSKVSRPSFTLYLMSPWSKYSWCSSCLTFDTINFICRAKSAGVIFSMFSSDKCWSLLVVKELICLFSSFTGSLTNVRGLSTYLKRCWCFPSRVDLAYWGCFSTLLVVDVDW